jgi:hypothetical protein
VTAVGVVLAHQGGWDEALFVLAPLLVIGLLLRMANKRADAVRRETLAEDPPPDTNGPAASSTN